jgi:hypothetical protein
VRFKPDLATVVKSFQDTADPELVAEHIVSFASDTGARRHNAHSS